MDLPTTALHHVDFGVIVQNAKTEILYANPAAVRLLSLDATEVLARSSTDPVWDLIRPDGSPISPEDHTPTTVARTLRPARGQLFGLWRPRTGDRAWMVADSVPVLDEAGELHRIVTWFRPVGSGQLGREQLIQANESLGELVAGRTVELEETVRQLRAAETEYRTMFNAMVEGVTVYDRDGHLRGANPAAERILGLTEEQIRGQAPVDPRWELAHADGTPIEADEIPQVVARRTGRRFRDFLMQVRRPPDDVAVLSVNVDPLEFEGEGPPYATLLTFNDITGQQKTLRQLEQSRNQIQSLTDTVPGLILEETVWDDGTAKFSFVSGRAREYLGISGDELRDDSNRLWNLLAPDDRDELLSRRAQVLKSGVPGSFEFPLQVRGARRWLRIDSGTPERSGDRLRVPLIIQDITEQRQLTQALYDTQRREGLGVLAAGVAHNFNNMLAAIIPTLEAAVSDRPGADREALEDALQAAQGAAELVRQIMTLAGRGDRSDPEPVKLADLMSEVGRICHRTLDRRFQVEVAVAPEARTATVLGRHAELQQVLLNLVMNSRDATEAVSQPRIRLALARDGEEAVIRVRDNGAGMPPEVLDRIGEPFFTTKPVGSGTGLGLATAFGILGEMGGSLTCDSREEEGTVFTARLPLLETPREPVAASAGGDDWAPPKGAVVLVVDDEPLVRNTVARLVQEFGVQVVSLSGGEAALDWLRDNSAPAAVFLDRSMPGMPGDEVLVRIRERHPGVSVVMMSGYLPEGDALDGAAAILQKPMRFRDVSAVLETLWRD